MKSKASKFLNSCFSFLGAQVSRNSVQTDFKKCVSDYKWKHEFTITRSGGGGGHESVDAESATALAGHHRSGQPGQGSDSKIRSVTLVSKLRGHMSSSP